MEAFFKLVAAGPMFFVSAWLLMIFAGVVGSDVGADAHTGVRCRDGIDRAVDVDDRTRNAAQGGHEVGRRDRVDDVAVLVLGAERSDLRGLATKLGVTRDRPDGGTHAEPRLLGPCTLVDRDEERIVEGIEDDTHPHDGLGINAAGRDANGPGSEGSPGEKNRQDGRNGDRPNPHDCLTFACAPR